MFNSLYWQYNTDGTTLSILSPYLPPLRTFCSFFFLCEFIYANMSETFAERAEIIQVLGEISRITLLS